MMGRGFALVLATIVGAAFPWSQVAAQGTAATPDASAAAAALAAFKSKCASCHGTAAELKRKEPAAGFGSVTDLAALVLNAKLVLPGNPDGSRLWRLIERDAMPEGADYGATDPLTAQEKEAIRAWIVSLSAKREAAPRVPISEVEIVSAVIRDLLKLSDARAEFARYFTIANIYNAGADEAELSLARAALAKLLNSLSTGPAPVTPAAIDREKTIFRVFIDDLGWAKRKWDKIAGIYPYAVDRGTRAERMVRQLLDGNVAVVRADWLAFRASQPPLYHEILDIPETDLALERRLGLDVAGSIKREKALRAGFQNSGVSQNNRIIERHEIPAGAYWKSYDFKDNKGRSDIFTFPLGPGGRLGFEHAGGEIIFNLANGFQAYMLVDEKGKRIDRGPTDIVQDRSRRDGTIINGISCMSCHDAGMKDARDEVRTTSEASAGFDGETLERIRGLYRPQSELDAVLKQDQNRFFAALLAAGVDPKRRSPDGKEPVRWLSDRFEAPVQLKDAAAEIGITEKELLDRMNTTAGLRVLKARLQGPGIPRDQFVAAFDDLLRNLGLGTTIKLVVEQRRDAPTEERREDLPLEGYRCAKLQVVRSGGRTVVRGFIAEGEDVRRLNQAAERLGVEIAAVTVPRLQCQVLSSVASALAGQDGPAVRLRSGTRPLRVGESIVIDVAMPSYPAHLYLMHVDGAGDVTHLSQPTGTRDHPLGAGRRLVFGDGANGGARLRVSPPVGTDTILVITSPEPIFHSARPKSESAEEIAEALSRALATLPESRRSQVRAAFVTYKTKE